jgi:hypothetical protein
VRNPADWVKKYLDCVNVGVPACENHSLIGLWREKSHA